MVSALNLGELRGLIADDIVRIDHIALAVEDLEASIGFYCGLLGFALVERRTTSGESTSMCSAVVRAGEMTIVLLQGTSANSQVTRFIDRFGPGVQHVAIRVRSLPRVLDALRTVGIVPDTELARGPRTEQVFLRRDGVTGVRLELIERDGGDDFADEMVEKLFRDFERKGLY